jgi:hypothetical protein
MSLMPQIGIPSKRILNLTTLPFALSRHHRIGGGYHDGNMRRAAGSKRVYRTALSKSPRVFAAHALYRATRNHEGVTPARGAIGLNSNADSDFDHLHAGLDGKLIISSV